jgi:hypothetical protein
VSSHASATSGLGLPGRGLDDLPGLPGENRHLLRGAGDGPASGSGEDPGDAGLSILGAAAAVRFPDLRTLGRREKIDALTDHIAATAIARGDVEALRLEAHANLLDMRDRWSRLPTFASKSQTDDQRRQMDPELARDIDRAQWLVVRCTEQINRLDRDFDAASRAYTTLSS